MHLTKKNPYVFFLAALFLFAYVFRIIYPTLFMIWGDLPGHIMASMRLYLTSPFETHDLVYNTLAQLLQFNHGYTIMLVPFLLYTLFFTFLHIPVHESTLVAIHALLGLVSIVVIYCFVAMHYSRKVAFLTALFLAVIPIHVGLSRAHVGLQIIQSIFFFGSLIALNKFLVTSEKKYVLFFFFLTLFYIGSDNAFFVGLMLQAAYALWFTDSFSFTRTRKTLKRIYWNLYTPIFILAPIVIYVLASIYSLRRGITSGFLLRLVTKVDAGAGFGVTDIALHVILLIGPVVFLFLYAILAQGKSLLKDRRLWFLSCYFLVYASILIVKSNAVERNYVFFLLVPLIVLPLVLLENKRFFIPLVLITLVLTFLYSLSVVYGFFPQFHTTTNYGSVHKDSVDNNDYGIKALGYLAREGLLPAEKRVEGKYGTSLEKIALFVDYEGAYYYLGAVALKNLSEIDDFDRYVVVDLHNYSLQNTEAIREIISSRNLDHIATISSERGVSLDLYSNIGRPHQNYSLEELNTAFDNAYDSMSSLVKIHLGHY